MRRSGVAARANRKQTELPVAICIYLIAERPKGATIGEIARLQLGGQSVAVEVSRVPDAVTQLVELGEVRFEEEKVVPA